MYTVIGPSKTRAMRVVWMLEELEAPYEQDNSGPGSETARRYAPAGKVPVLLDDGEPITDSAAILTYLADKHGQLTARPGTIARARQDAMTHRILDELDAVLWTAARHSFILPKDRRMPAIKDSLKWEFGESLARIAEGLTTDWIMGETFTVPDILLTHCLTWARAAKFEVSEPRLLTYLRRACERPAYQRASQTLA